MFLWRNARTVLLLVLLSILLMCLFGHQMAAIFVRHIDRITPSLYLFSAAQVIRYEHIHVTMIPSIQPFQAPARAGSVIVFNMKKRLLVATGFDIVESLSV